MTNISFFEFRQGIKVFIRLWMVNGILLTLLYACSAGRPVSQGIRGQVQWFEGDLMPGIGKKPVEGIPVKREIYFYRATRTSQAEIHDGVFYQDIQTERIKKIRTDKNGNFRVRLEPGRYSIFTKEAQGLFANLISGDGFINPAEVREGEVTDMVIRIDYEAAY
jgi:hypothetical protein